MKQPQASLLILAAMVLTALLALYQIQPPEVVPASADSTQFSAERTMKHVRAIASHPHPVGSSEDARVREYLLNELKALGLEPVIQKTTAIVTFDVTRAAVVQNIIARVKGTSNSKAVMLAAHYDSAPQAPGAADDGYAVAAALETIRALKTRPPLKNDIIILLTDGEEAGLIGAKAFVEEFPLQDKLGFVMNFEGRGSSGPSIMFETNDENGWVVREFRKAVAYKVAYSLTYDLYKLLPNNTDFTFLKHTASSGLNFAHIGSVKNYHSVKDDPDHLDQRTLQHHGSTMLACALHFGNLDLTSTRAPNVIYFPFLLPGFVIYPASWVVPLTVLATLLFLFVLVLGFKKRELRFWRLVLSFLVFVIRVAAAGGIVFFLWKRLGPTQPEFGYFYLDTIYHSDLYLLGFVAFGIFIVTLLHHVLGRRLGAVNLAVGALFLWLVFTWGATLYFPGGSYLFVWPLLFSLGAILYWLKKKEESSRSGFLTLVLATCAVPGIFLFTQFLFLLYQATTLFIVGGIIAFVVLLFATLQLQLSAITEQKPWLGPVLVFLIAVAWIGAALLEREPSDQFPRSNSVFYAVDADSGTAMWGTWDDKLDDWTSQFFLSTPDTTPVRQFFPVWPKPLIHTSAPVLSLNGPEAAILSDITTDTTRTLKLHIRSKRPSSFLSVNAEAGRKIYNIVVNGRHAEDSVKTVSLIPQSDRTPWILYFFGDGSTGFELDLTTSASRPLSIRIVDRSNGLPDELVPAFKPRPSWMMPRPYYVTDATLVGRTCSF